jgi:hypothetical protein
MQDFVAQTAKRAATHAMVVTDGRVQAGIRQPLSFVSIHHRGTEGTENDKRTTKNLLLSL